MAMMQGRRGMREGIDSTVVMMRRCDVVGERKKNRVSKGRGEKGKLGIKRFWEGNKQNGVHKVIFIRLSYLSRCT